MTEAFWQGYCAYQLNMSHLDNAFDRDTQEHIDWVMGWWQGAQDD